MQGLFGRRVFEAGGESYYWEDVTLYAILSGRWEDIERATRAGLAGQAHFESSGESPPEEQIDEAAAEYRYSRELITADETEAWLEARGVTAGDWMGFIEREVLLRVCEDRLEEFLATHTSDQQAVLEAMRVDWLCGDTGRELAEALAEWVAAAAAEGVAATAEYGIGATGETRVGMGQIGESAEYRALPSIELTAEEKEIASRLPGLDPYRLAQRLARIRRLQIAEAHFREQAMTPEAVRREVETHRLEWVRLGCIVAHFSSEAQAREAALCVREDGISLAEVAGDAGAEVEETRFFLNEAEAELRPVLLGAQAGDLIGPVRSGDAWMLFAVQDKALPALDDPDTAERATIEAVERAVRDQVTRRIVWRDQ